MPNKQLIKIIKATRGVPMQKTISKAASTPLHDGSHAEVPSERFTEAASTSARRSSTGSQETSEVMPSPNWKKKTPISGTAVIQLLHRPT